MQSYVKFKIHRLRPALKITENTIEQRLANWPVAHLATASPAGHPHLVPIVFAWHSKVLWSPIDGKAKSGTRLTRIKNILANPVASVLLDEYDNNWSRLWWLRVDVMVQVITLDNCTDEQKTSTNAAISALIKKYPQYKDIPVLTEPATIIAMAPKSFTSWQAS
jgi:PPOX class probable F420-dependent enzyme